MGHPRGGKPYARTLPRRPRARVITPRATASPPRPARAALPLPVRGSSPVGAGAGLEATSPSTCSPGLAGPPAPAPLESDGAIVVVVVGAVVVVTGAAAEWKQTSSLLSLEKWSLVESPPKRTS